MRSIIAFSIFVMVSTLAVPSSAFFGKPGVLEGAVRSINAAEVAVFSTAEDMRKVVEIQITNETKFDDEEFFWRELRMGEMVNVHYQEEDGTKTAISIFKVVEKNTFKIFGQL